MIGVILPKACRAWTWSWKNCDKAIHDENPSLWSTHGIFYNNIESICFAHTFDNQQQKINDEMSRMHENGRKMTNGIMSLFDDIMKL